MRFEQTLGGSEGVRHAESREMSGKCKGPEVCSQDIKVASADAIEVRR